MSNNAAYTEGHAPYKVVMSQLNLWGKNPSWPDYRLGGNQNVEAALDLLLTETVPYESISTISAYGQTFVSGPDAPERVSQTLRDVTALWKRAPH